ncbi:hypothetical protein BGZ83_009354 [Gryganskiella cystojenkinii]|nr:hypothetical protein BGZ83_009354 [Gryganskiella cystojenkinii]
MVNPLLLPEIVSTLSPHLDRQDLTRCLRVCHLWANVLEPELYRNFKLPKKVILRNREKRRRRRQLHRTLSQVDSPPTSFAPSAATVAPSRPQPSGHGSPQPDPILQAKLDEQREIRVSCKTLERNSIHIRSLTCRSLGMLPYLSANTRLHTLSLNASFNLKVPFLLSTCASSLRVVHLYGGTMDRVMSNNSFGLDKPTEQMQLYQESLRVMFKVMAEQVLGLEELRLERVWLHGEMPLRPFVLKILARIKVLDLRYGALIGGWPWQRPWSATTTATSIIHQTDESARNFLMSNLRSLKLTLNSGTISELTLLLRECPDLTSFIWVGHGDKTVRIEMNGMIDAISNLHSLERLEAIFHPNTTDEHWCKVVTSLPRLRSLDVRASGFGPRACQAVIEREIWPLKDRDQSGRSIQGTWPQDMMPLEELNVTHCHFVTSKEMTALLWSCPRFKVLEGTFLNERDIMDEVARRVVEADYQEHKLLWPCSGTLRRLEVEIKPRALPSDEEEVMTKMATVNLSAEAGVKDKTTQINVAWTKERERAAFVHQLLALTRLEYLKTNQWALLHVFKNLQQQSLPTGQPIMSTDSYQDHSLRQIRQLRWLRTVEIKDWIDPNRHDGVIQEPLIQTWLRDAIPSLRTISCLGYTLWEWEPPAYADGLPWNSRPMNL